MFQRIEKQSVQAKYRTPWICWPRRAARNNKIGKTELARKTGMVKRWNRNNKRRVKSQKRHMPAPKESAPTKTFEVTYRVTPHAGSPEDFARAVSGSRKCILTRMYARARRPPNRRWLQLMTALRGLWVFVALSLARRSQTRMRKDKPHKRMSSVRNRTEQKPKITKAAYPGLVIAGLVVWRKTAPQVRATKQRASPVSIPSSSQRTAEGVTKRMRAMRPRRRAR